MDIEDFRKLVPSRMKEELVNHPLMDRWVARLRESPPSSDEAVQAHIDWYVGEMRKEGADPSKHDPDHITIKVMISLALEVIAKQDGAIVIDGGKTRH